MRKIISAIAAALLVLICANLADAHEMYVYRNSSELATRRIIIYNTKIGDFFYLSSYEYDGVSSAEMGRWAPWVAAGGVFEAQNAQELQALFALRRSAADGSGSAAEKIFKNRRAVATYNWEGFALIVSLAAGRGDAEMEAQIGAAFNGVYLPDRETPIPTVPQPYAAAALVRALGVEKTGFDMNAPWGSEFVQAKDNKFIAPIAENPEQEWHIFMQDSIYTVYVDAMLNTVYRLNPDLTMTKIL